jgi:predicted PurR-regulated permease PerM
MNLKENTPTWLTPTTFLESMVRMGMVAFLVIFCFKIAYPFLTLMVWALMLAIMLFPLHQKIAGKLGGKQGLASGLMILAVILLIGPPIVFVSVSSVGQFGEFKASFEAGEVAVPAPDPGVRDWPLVGEKLFPVWNEAATDFPAFLEDHGSQLKSILQTVFRVASDVLGTTGLLLVAFLVAGVMMSLAGPGTRAMTRIFSTLAGEERGPGLLDLVVGTVRSVATGVLGVAFIQALLFAVGLFLAGVPASGLLAVLVLFLAIIQVPATLVGIPVIIWVWMGGDGSVVANIIYTVIFLVASLSDNFLKPMLLGRGVEAPMPVILIGALGGMMSMGMIGLFLGAVVLTVGYQIFMGWTDQAGLAMLDAGGSEDTAE